MEPQVRSSSTKGPITMVVSAIAYFSVVWLGWSITFTTTGVTPIWPASGVAIALVMLWGYRIWPGIAVGKFFASLLALSAREVPMGSAVILSALLSAGSTAEALLGVYLARRLITPRSPFNQVNDLLKFILLAGIFPATASATIGVTLSCAFDLADWSIFGQLWITWWVASLAGILVGAPFLIVWSGRYPIHWPSRKLAESVGVYLLLAAIIWLIFNPPGPYLHRTSYHLEYLILPIVVLTALRYGKRGVTMGTFLTAGIAAWHTLQGRGPFMAASSQEALFLLQLYLMVVATMGLILTAVLIERERAKDDLWKSEAHRALAIQASQIETWEWNIQTNEVHWSEGVETLFGLSPGTFKGTYEAHLALIHPEDREKVIQKITKTIENAKTGKGYHVEHRILTPDGESRWVEAQGRVYLTPDGEPDRILGTVSDITERKRAESTLRLIQFALDQTPQEVYLTKKSDTGFIYVNPAACQRLGYTREELITMTAHDIDPDFVQEITPADWEALKMMGTTTLESVHRTKAGETYPVEITVNYLEFEGEAYNWAFALDITNRKQVEKNLRESEYRYRSLVETLPTKIFVKDQNGLYLSCNQAYADYLGISQDELPGKTDYDFFPPEFAKQYRADDQEVMASGATREIEEWYLQENQKQFVQTLKTPLRDEEGTITGVLGIFWDITARKQMEEELRAERDFAESLINTAKIIVLVLDTEGGIIRFNPYMEKLSGYRLEEVQGKSWFEIFLPPNDHLPIRALFQEALNDTPIMGHINPILTKEGREIEIEWYNTPLKDAAGETIWLLSIGQDITERKQAEAALKESEMRFRTAFQTMPDAITISSLSSGRYLDVNEGFTKLTGYTREEALGRTSLELGIWGDAHDRERLVMGLWEAGEVTIEVELRNRNGQFRTSLLSAKMMTVQSEPCILAVTKDVEDWKEAQEALRKSETTLKTLLQAAPVGIGLTRSHRVISWCNEEMSRITGYTSEELAGKDARILYENKEEYLRIDQVQYPKIAKTGVGAIETRWQHKDGSIKEILLNSAAINPTDVTAGVIFTALDITERKHAEAERSRLMDKIQEEVQRIQQIINTVPEGVILLDSKLNIALANPAARRNLHILAPEQEEGHLSHLSERALTELLTSPPKGLWHEIKAEAATFEMIARPIETGPTTGGWVMILRDVTRERQVQSQAQQQERLAAIGQLAAGIAHDFNNIMAVIILYAQVLSKTPDLSQKTYERLGTIHQQAQQASNLIQQILDFSRRSILERQTLDMRSFCKEVVKLLSRTLPEHIKINFITDEEDYMVHADPTRIQQMIMNLALNARDAMPEGGTLYITLDRLPHWIRLTVADSGMGIPAKNIPHIFEPFFTTKAPGSGTGLGLAQVYGIVKQHEGEIDVTSKIGHGTTFVIKLPALSTTSETATKETRPLTQGHEEVILVVEDNIATRQALTDSLSLLSYQVLTAANGKEALGLIQARGILSPENPQGIALVLSDVVMPDMGGIALLHTLQSQNIQVGFILLTGHPLTEELENLKTQGLTSWLTKPPDLEVLSEAVAQGIAQREKGA